MLGADECGSVYSFMMCFLDAFPFENAGDEGGCEGVAGADRVGNLYHWRGKEGYVSGSEDVASVDAAGEDEHLEVIFAEQDPAFVLKVDAGITEEPTDCDQFFVVYLQYVARFHRVLYDLFCVESLAQIDVEHYQRIVFSRYSVEEGVDCVA